MHEFNLAYFLHNLVGDMILATYVNMLLFSYFVIGFVYNQTCKILLDKYLIYSITVIV